MFFLQLTETNVDLSELNILFITNSAIMTEQCLNATRAKLKLITD